jgi:hypothetical protein
MDFMVKVFLVSIVRFVCQEVLISWGVSGDYIHSLQTETLRAQQYGLERIHRV